MQSERDETVCVRSQTTKRGAFFAHNLKCCFNYLTILLLLAPLSRSRGTPAGLGHTRLPVFGLRRDHLAAGSLGGSLNQGTFTLAYKRKLLVTLIPVDPHQVAQADLIRCQQVRQRINNVALNGTLQVACAIALVRAFLQQEVASGVRYAEEKLSLGGVQNPLLHLPQLDIEHFLKLLAL